MLIKNIPVSLLPHLVPEDKVYVALQMMQEHHCRHLAVTQDHTFLGTISENILSDVDEELVIKDLEHTFKAISIKETDCFLKALSVMDSADMDILPVVDSENHYTGSLQADQLLKHMASFLQVHQPGGIIVLQLDEHNYSFSDIIKIVESNDAGITQLNTSTNADTGALLVTLKVNKMEVSDIVATFQRYDYLVKYYFGEELYTNELKNNYDNLMNYLNI